MKTFYYTYHVILTLLGCFLLFFVCIFYIGNPEHIFQNGGRREFLIGRTMIDLGFVAIYLALVTAVSLLIRHSTIHSRLRVKTFLVELTVFLTEIAITLYGWFVTVNDWHDQYVHGGLWELQ